MKASEDSEMLLSTTHFSEVTTLAKCQVNVIRAKIALKIKWPQLAKGVQSIPGFTQ